MTFYRIDTELKGEIALDDSGKIERLLEYGERLAERIDWAPFIRYHVIDIAAQMDVELGVPLASALSGDERVSAGIIPAGGYASPVYNGVKTVSRQIELCGTGQRKTASSGTDGMMKMGNSGRTGDTRSHSSLASTLARRCMST